MSMVDSRAVAKIEKEVEAYSKSAFSTIRRWWTGEIQGDRCVKNLLSSFGETLPSVGAALAGSVGSWFGGWFGAKAAEPAGQFVGELGKDLVDMLSDYFIELPKDEALEKAYKTIGVPYTTSLEDIERAYKKLALKYHPDRPTGDTKKMAEITVAMELIRASKNA